MSTDGETPAPRTRAEARAAREAAERASAPRSPVAEPVEAPAEPVEAPADPVAPVAEPVEAPGDPIPVAEPVETPADPIPVAEHVEAPADPTPSPRSSSDERSEETKRDLGHDAAPKDAAGSDAFRPASGSLNETSSAPKDRRFLYTLVAIAGVLAVVITGLSVVSLLQGPRLSEVQVNPSEAIETSGSRVILTANQALADIDPAQVSIEPAVPFTVDAAGRGIGIRFTVPLDDATEYSVRVADVTGSGGGPASDLQTSFTTPASEIFLLQRTAEGDDAIFRTDLTGERAVPVFSHPRINDYRATPTRLVVTVEDEDGSKILVMDRDGEGQRELPLPGDGFVSTVQVSDRGGMVGYIYSDRELSETSGRASVLVTQSLSGEGEPRIVEVGGAEASIAEWQFVPDSSAALFIDFEGTLSLDDRSGDAGAQPLGTAMHIQGISRGTYTAIVERVDGSIVELNLTDGSETPLATSDPDYGPATTITPYPGGTLRHVVARDASGLPTGQAIIRVDDDGAAAPIVEVGSGNAILQACASPSGQYAAVVVAPDLAGNAYDDMLVPLPQELQTHLVDVDSGEEMVVLSGFDVSWCRMAPSF